MGAYEIDVRSDGAVTRHFKTYIACRGYLKDFYETLGFSQVESIDDFRKGGKFETFGTHFELDMWIEYMGDDKQIIMETSSLCYKMRNFIDPENYLIENCLYDYSLFKHKDGLFIPSKSWRASVKRSIREFKDVIEEQPLDKLDFPIDEDNHFIPSKIYIDHIENLSLPLIGEIFARSLNIYEQKRKDNRNQVLKSAVPSLKNLKLQVIQRHKTREDHNDEVWCQLTCIKCEIFCFVKNTSLDPIVIFLMKCIFSVWYQHVYTIVPDESSDWNKAFPEWHICEKRNGVDLERLKMATYHDQDIYKTKNSLKPYFGFYKLLESFLEIYVDSFKAIRESSAIYLCAVWCDKIRMGVEEENDSQSTLSDNNDAPDSAKETVSKKSTITNHSVKKKDHPKERDVSKVLKGKEKSKKKQKVRKQDASPQPQNVTENKGGKNNIKYSRDDELSNAKKTTNRTAEREMEIEEEWTDTDSEVGSDVSLDNYKIENSSNVHFSDAQLRKITNPQMVNKVQQYLSLRSAMNNEGEDSSSRRRSRLVQVKRNKRIFKRLQNEIQTYIDVQDWYRQAKKDVKIQKSIHSFEYVDVDSSKVYP